MVKTFQLAQKGQYGSSIKVAPVTTESITNQETCLEVNGTTSSKIEPQSILPDASKMEVKDIYMCVSCNFYKSIFKYT